MIDSLFGSNSPIDRVRQRRRPAVRSRNRAGTLHKAGLSPQDEALLAEIMAEPMDFMDSPEFQRLLVKKASKSLSGVLVVTVLTSPYPKVGATTQKFSCEW